MSTGSVDSGWPPPPGVSRKRNAVEQLAGFIGCQHGRLAFFHDVLGTAHGMSRVDVQDLADD
jgi:hypothetical protein